MIPVTTSPYSNSARRQSEILDAAVRLSEQHGYRQITRDAVAQAAGCGYGSVNANFNGMPALLRAIVGHAVKNQNLIILAQFLADPDPDPAIPRLSMSLRRAVLAFLEG